MRIITFRPALLVLALVTAAALPAAAATLSDPAVDAYNVRVGTETFSALYKFTTNTALVETAHAITNMGSDTIKFYMGPNTSGQSGVDLGANITNLLTLARDEPSYRQVLNMPFRNYVIWEYPLSNPDAPFKDGNYTSKEQANDYREMYDLTCYLLTNYNNSAKTFYLGHWEGDGYLSVNNWTTNPTPAVVTNMIQWEINRQKAVDDAKNATAHSNVNVYYYAEANRVRDAMLNGANNNVRMINAVIPYVTNLDYISYSSYDAQNLSASDLYTTLNYMENHFPTNKAATVPGPRLWIGEYGWGGDSTSAQEPLNRAYIQRLLGWNWNGRCLPFILFWEMYSNYNPGGKTNFSLIDYTGAPTASWYLQHNFYNSARLLTAQFKETNGRLPTDTEFSAMTTPLLGQPLPTPVNLTVSNGGAAALDPATLNLSGTLAQGVYGSDEAAVWVFWGRHDGGTVPGNWEQSRFLGINTNFNPGTFSVILSNLVAQTNYFYRFYATNASGAAWAPAASQFTTVTINPAECGSHLQIMFNGYNRAETLTNFPALVNLSTNLPGFSYRQFVSPAGGDLRFTAADGLTPIPFEVDQWNTNGTSSVWVNVPSLSPGGSSVWAYWGIPLATNLPASSTNGAAWPDFDLVWHLKEPGLPYADSTVQYPANAGTAPTAASGTIGAGSSFNGSSQYLNPGPVNLGNAFTLSAWVKLDPAESDIQGIWANKAGGWNSPGFALYVNSYKTADGKLILETGDGTGGLTASTGSGAVPAGQWHLVTAVVNRAAGTARLLVDGTDQTQSGSVMTDLPNQSTVNFGRFTNSDFYLKGVTDEARIQSGVVSSNWVWASWATVATNATFESYSAVTQQSPVVTINNGGAGSTLLTWPGTGVGFALYSTTNLEAAGGWILASNQPSLINNQWQIDLPAAGSGIRFYRLKSQ